MALCAHHRQVAYERLVARHLADGVEYTREAAQRRGELTLARKAATLAPLAIKLTSLCSAADACSRAVRHASSNKLLITLKLSLTAPTPPAG